MNIIADLLELVDEDSSVTSYDCDGPIKKITITKNLHPRFCPNCGTRLHSEGLFQRHPNHPIFQDGTDFDITLIGHRWNVLILHAVIPALINSTSLRLERKIPSLLNL